MSRYIIEGSSKIFVKENEKILMQFKDTIHGAAREGNIEGTGHLRKAFTYHFYKYLESQGIKTHLDESKGSALTEKGIYVHRLDPVKIEILVRNVARGHWVDSHKVPVFAGGTVFDEPIVEFCLKWKCVKEDGTILDDPRITKEIAMALHKHALDPAICSHMIESSEEAQAITNIALQINSCYQKLLKKEGWILEDFKFEIGVNDKREFILIDEISPDCSRIRDSSGNSLTKDLFRQKKSPEEIYKGYSLLKEAVEEIASV